MKEFSILNSGKCPFCQEKLVLLDIGAAFTNLKCISSHIVVGFTNKEEWRNFAIYFVNGWKIRYWYGFRFLELFVSDIDPPISILVFDLFNYSFEQLENKIKNYVVFA
jgi:hypothetical protein